LHAGMCIALSLGAVTMIYPFLIMVSGSMRTDMDEADLDLVPRFLVDRDALYRKLLEYKYNENVQFLNRAHRKYSFFFRSAAVPERTNDREIQDFTQFVRDSNFPSHWRIAGGIYSAKGYPFALRQLHETLVRRFNGSLEKYSEAMGSP